MIKKLVSFVIAFSFIFSIPLILYYVGINFFEVLEQLDKGVAASIVAACGTVFAAVFTVTVSQHINKKREIDDAHREYKIKLYSKFIEFTIDWMYKHAEDQNKTHSQHKKQRDQKELEHFFISFSKELTLWASPEVIKAWSKFREQAGSSNSKVTLKNVDAIYRAMRRDLGNSNIGLESLSLIKLFLKEGEVDG